MVTFFLDDNQLCVLAKPLPLRSELLRMTAIELGAGKSQVMAPCLEPRRAPLPRS
jgi:hypothetical protein